jgi:predicted O-methyltransferase YrrM
MSKIQTLNFEGDASRLHQELETLCSNIPQPLPVKQKMLGYQMEALFILARSYNQPGARILEIGTGHGASGYMLAKAAHLARITSLTISPVEAVIANELWIKSGCTNIAAVVESSWKYLAMTVSMTFDMVFVDGDHNHIALDLPWFNRLAVDGLFLCHDYSPEGSRTPSPIVYAELNRMAERLGRPFDVSLIDDGKVGMVGFYRREGETA